MEKKIYNGDNGLANRTFSFKYMETTWINGNEISETEKTWTAENLDDFNRFRDIWQELEVSDEHYLLNEMGSLEEDGLVCMALQYTLETDYQENIKYVRGISYKIA